MVVVFVVLAGACNAAAANIGAEGDEVFSSSENFARFAEILSPSMNDIFDISRLWPAEFDANERNTFRLWTGTFTHTSPLSSHLIRKLNEKLIELHRSENW